MKALFVIPVLAILLATGCTTGSKGKTVYVAPEPVPTAEITTEAAAPAAPVEVAPVVVKVPSTARIDATSFLNALVLSGCEIDKAEYKEVTRGGGIIVTCTQRTGVLDAEGLGGL